MGGLIFLASAAVVAISPAIAPGFGAGDVAVALHCWHDLPPTTSLAVPQASEAIIVVVRVSANNK